MKIILPTGAFKVRGGVVFADRQSARRRCPAAAAAASRGANPPAPNSNDGRGLISATRGNHGQSLAWAGRRFGLKVTIVVPFGNSAEKNAAMEALGATLIEHGTDFEEAREEAHRRAAPEGLMFVPSFAPDLVKGVATYALELFQSAPPLDAVYVPIGLGSGICGTILARDLLGLSTQVIGVQSTGADCYAQSFAAGHVVPGNRTDTKADGIAVRQPDPEALRIILAGAERIVTVEDQADRGGDRRLLDRHPQPDRGGRRGAARRADPGGRSDARQACRADRQRRQHRSGAVSVMGRLKRPRRRVRLPETARFRECSHYVT